MRMHRVWSAPSPPAFPPQAVRNPAWRVERAFIRSWPGGTEQACRGGHSADRLVVEERMIKLLYTPLRMLAGVAGGVLAGAIFRRVWKFAGKTA
jgi:hypothetical protein